MTNKKLRDKPEAVIGLVFSQEKGFEEHESKEVFYKYEEGTDEEAFTESGYKQNQNAFPYGWNIYEKKDSEFRYLLAPGDGDISHDLYMYGTCFVFVRNRADMMEFFIRIAPAVSAEALHNLMEGFWGSEHKADRYSFKAAIVDLVRKLR
jgi:hypothetical protein